MMAGSTKTIRIISFNCDSPDHGSQDQTDYQEFQRMIRECPHHLLALQKCDLKKYDAYLEAENYFMVRPLGRQSHGPFNLLAFRQKNYFTTIRDVDHDGIKVEGWKPEQLYCCCHVSDQVDPVDQLDWSELTRSKSLDLSKASDTSDTSDQSDSDDSDDSNTSEESEEYSDYYSYVYDPNKYRFQISCIYLTPGSQLRDQRRRQRQLGTIMGQAKYDQNLILGSFNMTHQEDPGSDPDLESDWRWAELKNTYPTKNPKQPFNRLLYQSSSNSQGSGIKISPPEVLSQYRINDHLPILFTIELAPFVQKKKSCTMA